jgi:predicted AlkP superfamily pyrophosphatase or phosphodiesterase
MGMGMKNFAAVAALLTLLAAPAAANPVLMISIDGLRPGDVIDAAKRGAKVPNLRAFMAEGAYATGVRNVLPPVTYPDHTTLITGVWPAQHGITSNTVFDPLQTNMAGWYWYASDIRVPTLWDAVHAAHGRVASMSWPVSVGAASIDDNIPEYWRAHNSEDVKLIAALSTPGLLADLFRSTGIAPSAIFGENPENDAAMAAYAGALIAARHPQFMTLHVSSLDHYEHMYGPGSKEAYDTLAKLDTAIGKLIADARKAEPDLVIAIVSDHGFATVEHDVNLVSAFVAEGLVTYDADKRKVTAWQAMPWNAGGSTAIMLAKPDDAALKAKVAALLKRLASDPANGIAQVIDRPGIAALGGGPEPSFWVDYKLGYEGGSNYAGPLVALGAIKGTHGYFPAHPEMRATFMIAGPGLAKKGSLGEIDMRAIAPTLAKILGVSLPGAASKPLF